MLSQLKKVLTWPKTKVVPICFGADVNGPEMSIRISSALDPKLSVDVCRIPVTSSGELDSAMSEIARTLKRVTPRWKCEGAALALAGPVENNREVVLTNWRGTLKDRTVKLSEMNSQLFPKGKSTFLNDLEAGTFGACAAEASGQIDDHFEQLFTDVAPKGPVLSDNRSCVFAMGSGLGVGLIVKTKLLREPLVVATELGHLGMPMVGPLHENWEQEKKLFDFASWKWSNGLYQPEFEDISSNRGVEAAYEYLTRGKRLDEATISYLAKEEGDEIAKKALFLQYLYLFREAKLMSVVLGCESLVFALDNAVKNNWLIHEFTEKFRYEFYDYIRPEWMKEVRIYTQKKPLDLNILGANFVAHALAATK